MKRFLEQINKISLIDLINHTDDKLSFVDLEYIYRIVNDAYTTTFQKSTEEIVGCPIWEVIGQESFYSVAKPKLDQAFEGKEIAYEAWFDFPTQRCYLAVRYYPAFDEQGSVYGAFVTATDLTERKKLEEELRFFETLSIKQNKMAQIGDMTAWLAHQWRTPLNALSTHLLRLQAELPATLQRHHGETFERCEKLIETLSDHIESLHRFYDEAQSDEATLIQDAVSQACYLLGYRLQTERIEVVTSLEDACRLPISKTHLLHIFVTLIENSIDAFSHSSITARRITIRAYRQDQIACIHCCDNADGISQEIAHEIFKPGFTTKEGSHRGYGLFFVRKVIQDHLGGSIRAIDTDQGVCFLITLPL